MTGLAIPVDLRFDQDGLIPVVVQAVSGEVLTLAYANDEALTEMARTERTVFWSRSRRTLWRKGETSGNWQRVVDIKSDCDGDALLVTVVPHGPACHRGTQSCFESAQ